MFPIIFGALTFLSTLLGGFFAVRYRNRLGILVVFAAGVLIAVSLFDLLPEAHEKKHPLVSIMFTLLGFLLIFVIKG